MPNRSVWIACLVGLSLSTAAAHAQSSVAAGAGGAAGVGGGASGMSGGQAAYFVTVARPEIAVPSNGAVLLEGDYERLNPVVEVRSAAGEAIYGHVRQISESRYWAWTPEHPLEIGDYTVSVVEPLPGSTAAITVIEAIDLVPPAITSAPEAQWSSRGTAEAVCRRWTGSQLVDDTSFITQESGRIDVAMHLMTSADPVLLNQLLFRAFPRDAALPSFHQFGTLAKAGPYVEQAAEYCFGLEAMILATHTLHTYPELARVCVAHGELPNLAERDATVPDSALDRFVCQAPPDGYEARWCALNGTCEELTPELRRTGYGCELYGYACLGESLPSIDSDAELDPTRNPHADGLDGKGNGGCTVGAQRTSVSGWAALGVALACITMIRRKVGKRSRALWIASLVGLAVFAASARAQGPEIDWGMAAGAGGFVSATGGGAPVGSPSYLVDPTNPIPSNGSILLLSDFQEPIVEVWGPAAR